MDNDLLVTKGDVTEFYTKKVTSDQRNMLIEKLRELEGLFSRYSYLSKYIDDEIKKYRKMPNKKEFFGVFWPYLVVGGVIIVPGWYFVLIICFIVVSAVGSLVRMSSDAMAVGSLLLSLFAVAFLEAVIISFGIVVSSIVSRKKSLSLAQAKRDKYEEIETKKSELNDLGDILWEKSFLLPDAYCCEVACGYIAACFEKYRAESMKEAFNLYEEQLHRWKLEEAANESVRLQQQQMALQQRQLNEIRGVKINSGISAAAGVYTVLRDIF